MSLTNLIVNLVNPRFRSFSKPLFLAISVGSATLVLTGGFFLYQLTFSETCSSVNFPTPQPQVEETVAQYTAGFNGQVEYVKQIRFGGTHTKCQIPNTRCGVGGTVASSGLRADLGGGSRQPGQDLPPGDASMFYMEETTSETLPGSGGRSVTVSTLKRTERAVCLSDVSAFIVADISRETAATSNASNWPRNGADRRQDYVSNVIHSHPQVGTWRCNPPTQFYQLKANDMSGVYLFHPSLPPGVPGVGHYATWVDDAHVPTLAEGTYSGHPLPVCGFGGPDGAAQGQPPPVGTNTYPFYSVDAGELASGRNYECTARSSVGGNELPVIASYRIFTTTRYNVTWSPTQLCEPTPLLTALGTALAYSTYFEIICTLLVVGVLLQAQAITMSGPLKVGEWATGDIDQNALNERLIERIKTLEQKLEQATDGKSSTSIEA